MGTKDAPDAHRAAMQNEGVAVFSLDEVVRIIEAWDSKRFMAEAKRTFPGAQVAEVRPAPVDWQKGDELPTEMLV